MPNPEFDLAEDFALRTNHPLFLTGKAGSGKTTLLKKIAATTHKNFVIVAPTGVAAINAGGVTIHSMFNLPLTSFIPSNDAVDFNLFTNHRALLNHMKFRREKLNVIREMELLIIDEVSMVRADILDAIDFVMQNVRHRREPFGGVQVMLIGDMHQLPPVVKDHEWETLKNYYKSPFFFDSKVWNEMDAAEIELKKIYRQSDERFVSLLNNIRHQLMSEGDFDLLKSRYLPTFKTTEPGYILLTTHNHRASSINETELKRLSGESHFFEALIDGEFPEHIYPCEKKLELKVGTQVMFTRNDTGGGKEYYNGKIATVKSISEDDVIVTFNDSHHDFKLRREEWENINYTTESGTDKILKNVMGTFSQYPLRLAWAITIHKSQGLTFNKVIIDAGSSFASGQVYVALSRCTSLEGIVLHSLITQSVLYGDNRITAFSTSHHTESDLQHTLEKAKLAYANYQLRRLFSFDKLRFKMEEWKDLILEKNIPDKEKAIELQNTIAAQIEELITTADKFQIQLERLLAIYQSDQQTIVQLKERSTKAIEYFTNHIFTQLITPLHQYIGSMAYKSKVKKYLQHIQTLEQNFWTKTEQLYAAKFLDENLFAGEIKHVKSNLKKIESSVSSAKKIPGGTYKDTLDLHLQGKTVEEISAIRSLTVGTIQSHFARWIESGDVKIEAVLAPEVIEPMSKFISENNSTEVTSVRNHFGEKYSYNEIRMVLNDELRKRKSKKE